ncbi:MAG: hypothetical protein IIB62_11755 [Proteobacteria bacterium]|nr:hypothetical protein [Pseudomonadota bacterium]
MGDFIDAKAAFDGAAKVGYFRANKGIFEIEKVAKSGKPHTLFLNMR